MSGEPQRGKGTHPRSHSWQVAGFPTSSPMSFVHHPQRPQVHVSRAKKSKKVFKLFLELFLGSAGNKKRCIKAPSRSSCLDLELPKQLFRGLLQFSLPRTFCRDRNLGMRTDKNGPTLVSFTRLFLHRLPRLMSLTNLH